MLKDKVSKLFILLITASLSVSLAASAQNLQDRPLQKLIDCPSAGGPEMRSYDFELRAFPEGGVLISFAIGMFPRFTLGLLYGGTEIIGNKAPKWNPQPGVRVAYRFLNESIALPGLAIGYINQGYGRWDEDEDRYQYQAKGFYAALGKNFLWHPIGEIGLHLGTNYNPAEASKPGLDFFSAIDYKMTTQLAVIFEYSLALDDYKASEAFGRGRGYLNAGLRWSFGERLALDFNFRDILVNQKAQIRRGNQIGREIRISYLEKL